MRCHEDPFARRRPSTAYWGPIDLSALVHRKDWAMWLILTADAISSRAHALMGPPIAADAKGASAAVFMQAVDLSFAYQHALNLHPQQDEHFAVQAQRSVSNALSQAFIIVRLMAFGAA